MILDRHHVMINTLVLLGILVLSACGFVTKNVSKKSNPLVELPDDLSSIPDSLFMPLMTALGSAQIIGLTEGTHGMNEPLDFRNSLIKYLVRNDNIGVIALESGLIESRMVNDFILGKSLSLDSVLSFGISYTFGNFDQNRSLLVWLKEFNTSQTDENKIKFYGFDVSGNAPNPVLENNGFALHQCLDYLKTIDPESFKEANEKWKPYIDFLRIKDSPEDTTNAYSDLSTADQKKITTLIDELIVHFQNKQNTYSLISGESNFTWALRSAVSAKQNIDLLAQISGTPFPYSVREKSMFDNLQWIQTQENKKPIVLFAHLAHLTKDIYVLNENGENTMPNNQFGEYLNEYYGDNYKVIGNFYCHLDYYDGVDSVKNNSFPQLLNDRFSATNFYLGVDQNDVMNQQPMIFGVPSSGGDVWITPSKGIDVIFFNETQHFFYKQE